MPRHDPLSDEQIETRSVLMRLYHSHFIGEPCYPKHLVNGHAPDLVAAGWIEAHLNGWRITESGITAWAKMNAHSLGHKRAQESALFDELRMHLELDAQAQCICRKEGCNQPRHQSVSGAKYLYCAQHQAERWAGDKRRRNQKKQEKEDQT